MKETWSEAEVVLQPPLSQKEMNCAEQVAKELDLLTEKVNYNSLKYVGLDVNFVYNIGIVRLCMYVYTQREI